MRPGWTSEASSTAPTRVAGRSSSAKGRPKTSASPSVGRARPSSRRRVVVLPAPFGPRKPVTLPAPTSKDRSLTAVRSPKRLVSPSAAATAMPEASPEPRSAHRQKPAALVRPSRRSRRARLRRSRGRAPRARRRARRRAMKSARDRPRQGPTRRARARPLLARADLEEALDGDHVAAKLLAARDALDLAQLLQRVDPHVRVGADAERDRAREQALERWEPVAEVRLGRGAEAHAGACLRQEVELALVGVRPVDDRRARPEAPGLREQLDGPQAVLGQALLDLARLLVCVDVEDEALACAVGADLLEPLARAGADGVGASPTRAPAPASSSTCPR